MANGERLRSHAGLGRAPGGLALVLWAGLGLAGCASSVAPGDVAAPSGSGALTIRVTGVASSEGQVLLALYGDAETFEAGADAAASRVLPAGPGCCVWTIEELSFGDYAVKAYHDLNDNGLLDKGAFGAPVEPYGFSNAARGRVGPPGFGAARFRFGETGHEITVAVER